MTSVMAVSIVLVQLEHIFVSRSAHILLVILNDYWQTLQLERSMFDLFLCLLLPTTTAILIIKI